MTRSRYRTQFCFISPASLLDRYASHSHIHLLLPHVTNPKYVEFYQRKRSEGDLLILDNGAYEFGGAWHYSAMKPVIEKYNPHIVVLPDFLLKDGEATFEAARASALHMRRDFPYTKLMYVPQAVEGDYRGWKKWMNVGIKEIKPDWVGIPRALATHIGHPLARVDVVEELTMRGIKTHCLGMANGDLKELELLFWEGCCSIDNSSPIWRGLHCHHLDSPHAPILWNNEGTPVDFDWNGNLGSIEDYYIKHNMNLINRILNQPEIK